MRKTGGWLLKVLTSVAFVAAEPGCVVDQGYEPPVECARGLETCARECVDLLSNRSHCGACGQVCGRDARCVSGDCVCAGGLESCESGCVDSTTDPQNCGRCGMACDADQVCSGGRCQATCPPSESECARACIDSSSNPSHCGACNEACDSGQVCVGGECACRASTDRCDGECVDLASDADHCGACGTECGPGEVCSGGRCHCPGGSNACDGSCADLFFDDENCGACGSECGAEVCSLGVCRPSCNQGLTECADSCVDLDTNESHCGQCGNTCDGDEVCVEGVCRCPAGREACADGCVDLTSDAAHCGGCELYCAADQVCNAGRCECPGATLLCGTACVDVEANPSHCGECNRQCGDDEVCSGGRCREDCRAGEDRCGAACVDLATHARHCGECENACDPSLECHGGQCECPNGSSLCDGACVDTGNSSSHCGGCDQPCGGNETCILGQCQGRSECTDSCPHASGVTSGCKRRFLYGVNYGWENFAGDFGGIPAWNEPGVSEDEAAVDARLADMAEAGVDVVRWWVWPDFRGSGVEFDDSDAPTGLGSTAVADLEKALELAEENDLRLMLTLFSFDNFRPSRMAQDLPIRGLAPIATDAGRRALLVDHVIRPFARAAEQSPHRDRLLAWDVINEPEWAMTGPSKYCRDDALPAQDGLEHLSHDQMEVFVSDVIRGLRSESSALVTVGGAGLLWACAWKYVDIDFYQFHIYDWIDEWAPYERAPSEYGVSDRPSIMGEFPLHGLSRASYTQLVDTWYDSGWAGALGWAVTDRSFDWNDNKGAVASFANDHSCETSYSN